jgi:hypothetical protein
MGCEGVNHCLHFFEFRFAWDYFQAFLFIMFHLCNLFPTMKSCQIIFCDPGIIDYPF